MRFPALAATLLLDALLCAVTVVALAIVLTGGWTFEVSGHVVRAHHVGSLLGMTSLLGACRLAAFPQHPFLMTFPPADLEAGAIRALERLQHGLRRLDGHRGGLTVLVIAACCLILKLGSAYSHPGFLTGDDVEIHEMTFARLLHQNWPAWNLRSPFFPMTFIYPAQALAQWVGITEPALLILVGRTVVATLSTVAVVVWFRVLRRCYGAPVAAIASTMLAVGKLQLIFGASELPRPVATLFLVSAFGCLQNSRWRSSIAGGALIGVAAALRFSEILFLVPAALQLLLERRVRDAIFATVALVTTAAAIQAISDYVYWGTAFSSLRHIVEFTLVERNSSRGFEPIWFYLTSSPDWTNFVLLGLMLLGAAIADRRAVMWAALPILLLSLFPHKEPRYLVPATPFLALLAAQALWRIVQRVGESERAWPSRFRIAGIAALVAVGAALLTEVNAVHFARSDSEVRLARSMAADPRVKGVAAEQLWRLGGRLYFAKLSAVVDLDPSQVGQPLYLREIASTPNIDVIFVDEPDVERVRPERVLLEAGFQRLRSSAITEANMAVFSRLDSKE